MPSFKPSGVCPVNITYDIDEEKKVRNVAFLGGCDGNLKILSKLLEGVSAEEVVEKLEGNTCGMKNTSCADQLARAIKDSIS